VLLLNALTVRPASSFDNDYLRDHVSLGYAITVHSAQGVTADTSHAVLSENTSRAMRYVATTAGATSIPFESTNAQAGMRSTAIKN
jgi:hypothetical protein